MSEIDNIKVGDWTISTNLNRISDGKQEKQLVPKVMKLLSVLVANHGQVVSQEQLIRSIWLEQVVSDSSLYQAVASLRKALGDSSSEPQYIERISGRGYRLIANVEFLKSESPNIKSLNIEGKTQLTSKLSRSTNVFAYWLALLVIIILLSLGLVLNYLAGGDEPAPLDSGQTDHLSRLTVAKVESVTLVDLEKVTAELPDSVVSLNDVLLTQLAHIQGLRVVHLRQEQSFKTQAVIRGKITQENDNVRVFLQIEDVAAKEIIWAKFFEGQSSQLFELQDKIRTDLFELFERKHLSKALQIEHQRNSSFDKYLMARNLWKNKDLQSLLKAKRIFEDMQKKKTLFPLAAVGLCDTYQYLHFYSDWELEKALALCEPLLEDALSTQPNLGEAIAAQGLLLSHQNKTILAKERFELAIKNAPNYPFTYVWYGRMIRELGDYTAALELTQKAYQLSPMSPLINRSLAYTHLNLRQVDKAKYFYQRSLELDSAYDHQAVSELDFYPLNIERAINLILWADKHENVLQKRPNAKLTEAQVKLALGMFDQVSQTVESLEARIVNPSFLLYIKAALASAKEEPEKCVRFLKERLMLHENNQRFLIPYIMALMENGQNEAALNQLSRIYSSSGMDSSINTENYFVAALYVRLMTLLEREDEIALLNTKIDTWVTHNYLGSDIWLAEWQLHSGQKEQSRKTILQLMNEGWLPDFNSDIFAYSKMKKVFVKTGLGELLFEQLLTANREKVLLNLPK